MSRIFNRDLFRQIGPFFSVGKAAIEQRFDPREGLRQGAVERPADDVDELHLHLRQLVLPLAVHHGLQRQKQFRARPWQEPLRFSPSLLSIK